MMNESLLHFVETTVFTKRIDKLASPELLFDLQNDLLLNPKRGEVISGTNGARKARIGDRRAGRGKSGAFRYLYLYPEKAGMIYLLVFFSKNEKDNLSKAERNEIAALVRHLKNIYGEN
ncbi:MAG: type II toxin-antitoxin system RelE/ParE family toxin [Pyrinomonadaceae bacterium]